MNDFQLRQEAVRITQEVLSRAAAKGHATERVVRPRCLVERHPSQGDLSNVPDGTVLITMASGVAAELAKLGLREPVSLTQLKGLWWVAQVDAAHIYRFMEYGGAYCTVAASTHQLVHEYSSGYCSLVQGPFETAEQARQAIPPSKRTG